MVFCLRRDCLVFFVCRLSHLLVPFPIATEAWAKSVVWELAEAKRYEKGFQLIFFADLSAFFLGFNHFNRLQSLDSLMVLLLQTVSTFLSSLSFLLLLPPSPSPLSPRPGDDSID